MDLMVSLCISRVRRRKAAAYILDRHEENCIDQAISGLHGLGHRVQTRNEISAIWLAHDLDLDLEVLVRVSLVYSLYLLCQRINIFARDYAARTRRFHEPFHAAITCETPWHDDLL